MATTPLLTLADYESRARERLRGPEWDGLFSAPGDRVWRTNQGNIAAYDRWLLRPRVLVGNDARDLATTVLGQPVDVPILIAPSGSHQRVCAEGETATARAAGRAGTVMVLSSVSNFSIEEVAAAASGPLWFQLYVLKDRQLTTKLVRRAEEAGYRALVVSVDNIAGRPSAAEQRRIYPAAREQAPPSTLEQGRECRNLKGLVPEEQRPTTLRDMIDRTLSWRDIEWLREHSGIPVVVKGIQTHEDARLCVESGADAIVVSNHGGVPLELEGVRASLDALPEIVDAVGADLEVYLDGGIRHGRDVLKALALGARAVLTGRPVQWGLAVNGEAGVVDMLGILRRQLDSSMGIAGLPDVKAIGREAVVAAGSW
ncbi:alpha-hydroxy-acid oxidizing protein [Streptomyces sp. SID8361]|nr:alpha-hydroxy-acid oxidizing protein [Streptomyces sp. SID8361]